MLLQTNSYIVPKDKRAEHARLLRRFRAALAKLGCDSFEVYEQVGSNWNTAEPTGRYVQIMRFRDRRHQVAVQAAERTDPASQAIIAEFCQLINFPYQQQQGLFAVGFYNSVLPVATPRVQAPAGEAAGAAGTAEAPESHAPEQAVAGAAAAAMATGAAATGAAAADFGTDDAESERAAQAIDPTDDVAEGIADDIADEAGTLDDAVEEDAAVEDSGEELSDAGDESLHADDDAAPAEDLASAADAGETGEPPVMGADDTTTELANESEAPEPVAARQELADDAAAPGVADGAAADEGGAEEAADELGALLDAHLEPDDAADGDDARHPIASEAAGDDAGGGLDALDLDDLELPDEPAADQGRAQNHFAR